MDDLKEKLAAQEVELKQKNEDADALIQRVGVEQEKVETRSILHQAQFVFDTCLLRVLHKKSNHRDS